MVRRDASGNNTIVVYDKENFITTRNKYMKLNAVGGKARVQATSDLERKQKIPQGWVGRWARLMYIEAYKEKTVL